ncbi:MAG: copper resistance protein B [Rhodospirillales bacterium]|nr:copper resistance protein B [Rhodospirillales bacterium]
MNKAAIALGAIALGVVIAPPLKAEEPIYGVQLEQLEYRFGDKDTDVMAWDGDALYGTDDLKFVLRSEGEFETKTDKMETLETQLRLQTPVSTFFDAVAGIRFDTPEGQDRVHGVVGLHGLAPQWFEIDADLFVSDYPSFRFEAEYEALITNYWILTPSIEFDLPLRDDPGRELGAWGPKVEIGARLSYDLIDRAVAPYIGVHYERYMGETQDIREAEGEDADGLFFVTGFRLMF